MYTRFRDKIAYVGGPSFRRRPWPFGERRSRAPSTSATLYSHTCRGEFLSTKSETVYWKYLFETSFYSPLLTDLLPQWKSTLCFHMCGGVLLFSFLVIRTTWIICFGEGPTSLTYHCVSSFPILCASRKGFSAALWIQSDLPNLQKQIFDDVSRERKCFEQQSLHRNQNYKHTFKYLGKYRHRSCV